MEKTWKPTTAGILNIIVGAISTLSAIGIIIALTAVNTLTFLSGLVPSEELPFVAPLVSTILVVILILNVIEAVFPILGGVYALQRRKWGWALAGSIISIIGLFPLGLLATIFVSLAREEFGRAQ